MWTFIGFIVLIAIIFGVSLHDAFWGFIALVFGIVFAALLFMLGSAGLLVGKYKLLNIINRPKCIETETKKMLKKEQRKKKIQTEIATGLLAIWLFTPFLLVTIFSTVLKDYTEKNPWIYIFAFLPYLLPIGFAIFAFIMSIIKKIFKKRTN